jgi:hypothetical protein
MAACQVLIKRPSYSFVDNIYYSYIHVYRILSVWGRTLRHRVIGRRRFEAEFCLNVKGRNVQEGKHVASRSRNSISRPCRVIFQKKENLSYAAAKFQKIQVTYTVMRRLTTGIHSEKGVVRRFRRCANVIECTYTNIDSLGYMV